MKSGPILITACIAGETGRELCFKRAARAGAWSVRDPALWCGLLLWGVEVLLWIATLQQVPLVAAVPLMALSFATVPLAAQLLLGERIRPGQCAGIALIGAGALCVGLAGSFS